MPNENSALDIIWEVGEIAKAIGRTERQTFHLLQCGQLPGRKVGGRWCISRAKLVQFFEGEAA